MYVSFGGCWGVGVGMKLGGCRCWDVGREGVYEKMKDG